MTDPHVLVKLDVLVALQGVIAVLLALRVVIDAPGIGLLALVVIGLAVTLGAR